MNSPSHSGKREDPKSELHVPDESAHLAANQRVLDWASEHASQFKIEGIDPGSSRNHEAPLKLSISRQNETGSIELCFVIGSNSAMSPVEHKLTLTEDGEIAQNQIWQVKQNRQTPTELVNSRIETLDAFVASLSDPHDALETHLANLSQEFEVRNRTNTGSIFLRSDNRVTLEVTLSFGEKGESTFSFSVPANKKAGVKQINDIRDQISAAETPGSVFAFLRQHKDQLGILDFKTVSVLGPDLKSLVLSIEANLREGASFSTQIRRLDHYLARREVVYMQESSPNGRDEYLEAVFEGNKEAACLYFGRAGRSRDGAPAFKNLSRSRALDGLAAFAGRGRKGFEEFLRSLKD